MKKQIDYWLIWKSLNDTLTDSEKNKLENWLQSDISHKDYYEKIKRRHHQNIKNNLDPDVNLDVAWKRVSSKHINAKFFHRYVKLISIAAGIILVLLLGYYSQDRPVGEDRLVSLENISVSPGMKKATLILNDGEKVELDSSKNIILEKSDVLIRNSNKSLDYQHTSNQIPAENFNQLVVPRGGEYFLRLADGTEIWVNSETVLRYPVVFGQNERRIELIGEAYFEVKSDSLWPFIVASGEQTIRVLGTSFNVKSYADEDEIVTSLVEGVVTIQVNGENTFWEILEPGIQSVYIKGSDRIKLQKVDMKQFTSWKDGRFYFRKKPVGEILKTLSRWYDVEFVVKSIDLEQLQFNGNLKRYDNIQPILNQLSKTNEIKFSAYGKTIIVDKQ